MSSSIVARINCDVLLQKIIAYIQLITFSTANEDLEAFWKSKD